jgi:hypothetical protein
MGFVGYIDDGSGLVIQSYRGEITQMAYIAARKDRKSCPSYYENPRGFGAVFIELCCPSLNLNCPQDSPAAGERITFSVSTSENEPSFHWEITEGRIVSGQGTSAIIVDTAGLEGKTVTATIEMSFGHSCTQLLSLAGLRFKLSLPIESAAHRTSAWSGLAGE